LVLRRNGIDLEGAAGVGVTGKVRLITMSLNAADVWRLTSDRKETRG
jgi:hypothetical protein